MILDIIVICVNAAKIQKVLLRQGFWPNYLIIGCSSISSFYVHMGSIYKVRMITVHIPTFYKSVPVNIMHLDANFTMIIIKHGFKVFHFTHPHVPLSLYDILYVFHFTIHIVNNVLDKTITDFEFYYCRFIMAFKCGICLQKEGTFAWIVK